jgi:hypothetical protein
MGIGYSALVLQDGGLSSFFFCFLILWGLSCCILVVGFLPLQFLVSEGLLVLLLNACLWL